jgi:restriction endonuclease S subunit
MMRLCKTQNATIAIQAKQIAKQAELLQKRMKVMKGERVQLEGVVVYITADV